MVITMCLLLLCKESNLTMFKSIIRLISGRKKLSVVIYHQVLAEHDFMRPDEMTAARFDMHLKWLTQNFHILTLKDAVTRLKQDDLPPNAAVITFDDGYENNASVALPLLNKYQVPATFFIASDFLNGGAMWNDKVIETVRHYPESKLILPWEPAQVYDLSTADARMLAGKAVLLKFKYMPLKERSDAVEEFAKILPGQLKLMMTDAQVKELHAAGMEIGGHTCGHPILATMDDDEAFKQISDNKIYLENILGEKITSFAYPNGKPDQDYTAGSIEQVIKAGYQCAVSTSYGVSSKNTNVFQLPRFTPWSDNRIGFMRLMARNYFNQSNFV
jgi:peptidoglycan/xylan/chitin deacetylase (PgdA/CDA1 family)